MFNFCRLMKPQRMTTHKIYFLAAFLLLSLISQGQLYKISGIILDNKRERLPLASVEIKELKKGTVSKDDGSFEFYLERGRYDLVVSMVGFKPKVVSFFINNSDITENVELEPDESSNMQEVVIKAKLRDRAEEIIKNVIRNKETVLNAIGDYSCNAYIKAFQLDSNYTPKKDGDTTVITDYSKMGLT